MASSWGNSWSTYWGNSWGATAVDLVSSNDLWVFDDADYVNSECVVQTIQCLSTAYSPYINVTEQNIDVLSTVNVCNLEINAIVSSIEQRVTETSIRVIVDGENPNIRNTTGRYTQRNG